MENESQEGHDTERKRAIHLRSYHVFIEHILCARFVSKVLKINKQNGQGLTFPGTYCSSWWKQNQSKYWVVNAVQE